MEITGLATSPAAVTIDQVVARLDDGVRAARRERSCIGYFAALYRGVTARVRDGIASGRYEDGPRMERLVVVFANRYLDALDRFRRGEHPGHAWQVAFSAAPRWRPIVLQHLLLGINAHINLDLGVACVQTSVGDGLGGAEASVGSGVAGAEANVGDGLAALRPDFDAINDLLGELTDEVQERLTRIWPPLAWLDRIGAGADEKVFHFSLRVAREAAWAAAERLAALDREALADEVARLDQRVAVLGHLILHPGFKGSLIGLVVRLGESDDVATVIDILS